MFYIYSLTNPLKSDKVFYVGKSKNPEGRLWEHLWEATKGINSSDLMDKTGIPIYKIKGLLFPANP